MADQFREAEAAYSVLRMKFNEKKISPQEFADSLKQLRIKDDEGRFWVIGARSGKWYAFERGEWIEAKPPSQLEKKAICIACGFENDLEALADRQRQIDIPAASIAGPVAPAQVRLPVTQSKAFQVTAQQQVFRIRQYRLLATHRDGALLQREPFFAGSD